MLKKLLILFLLLPACSTVQTTVTPNSDGSITVDSQRDAVVEFDNGKTKIKVDNRGNKSTLDSAVEYMIYKELQDEDVK